MGGFTRRNSGAKSYGILYAASLAECILDLGNRECDVSDRETNRKQLSHKYPMNNKGEKAWTL